MGASRCLRGIRSSRIRICLGRTHTISQCVCCCCRRRRRRCRCCGYYWMCQALEMYSLKILWTVFASNARDLWHTHLQVGKPSPELGRGRCGSGSRAPRRSPHFCRGSRAGPMYVCIYIYIYIDGWDGMHGYIYIYIYIYICAYTYIYIYIYT